MRYSQFISKVDKDSEAIAEQITPKKRRIKQKEVKEAIKTAYYSGCLNTYDQIKRDPNILKTSIGFIK